MSEHRFAVRRRAVDRPPRSAALARALARPAPGLATAALTALAVLAGMGHGMLAAPARPGTGPARASPRHRSRHDAHARHRAAARHRHHRRLPRR